MLFAGEVVSIAALLTSVYDDGVGEEKQEEKAWGRGAEGGEALKM